jgi:sugar phosphate isomerase/epimerase
MSRIGLAQWCLGCTGPEAIDRTAELGIDLIHLDFGVPGEDNCLGPKKWRKLFRLACENQQVEVGALAVNVVERIGLLDSRTFKSAKCQEIAQRAVDTAAAWHVPLIYIPSFHESEMRNEQDINHTADFLRKLCVYAEGCAVEVATENTLGVNGNLQLVRQTDHPKLRILFDSYNPFLWGHRPSELVEALRQHFCTQIHMKDGRNRGMGNASLGEGEGRFHETAKSLVASGFNGKIILENDYKTNGKQLINKDVGVLRAYFPQQN